MPSLIRATAAAAFILASLAGGPQGRSSRALASDEACARAYERAQEQRRQGRLTLARAELLICAQTTCPTFVVNDCRRWFDEVETALPTVAFAVRQGGRDLEKVRVSCDGVLLASRLDGRALPVDPGKHTFTIEVPGTGKRTVEALIVEGKKNRLIELDLGAAPAGSAVAASGALSAGAPSTAPRPQGGPPLENRAAAAASPPSASLATWGLAAAGAAGLAGFAGFGLSGWREERNMRERCAPSCSSSEVRGVRRSYLLADVSLGLGLGSLALAAYLHARGASPAAGREVAVDLRLGDRQGWLQVGRTF